MARKQSMRRAARVWRLSGELQYAASLQREAV